MVLARQTPAIQIVATLVVATISTFLALVSPASAEILGGSGSGEVTEALPSTESVPAEVAAEPALSSAPELTEAPEAPPVPEATAAAVPETAESTEADLVESVTAATEAAPTPSLPATAAQTSAPSPRDVVEAVNADAGEMNLSIDQGAGSIDDVSRSVGRVAQEPDTALQTRGSLRTDEVLELGSHNLSELTAPTRGALDLGGPIASDARLPVPEATSGPGPHTLPQVVRSFEAPMEIGGPLSHPEASSESLPGSEPMALNRPALLPLGAASQMGSIGLAGSVALGGTGASRAIDNFDGPAPFNPHGPLPESPPTIGVSGSGGSVFVPVAALLALLALVVPATFRRRWAAPDIRMPAPFVCALERPG